MRVGSDDGGRAVRKCPPRARCSSRLNGPRRSALGPSCARAAAPSATFPAPSPTPSPHDRSTYPEARCLATASDPDGRWRGETPRLRAFYRVRQARTVPAWVTGSTASIGWKIAGVCRGMGRAGVRQFDSGVRVRGAAVPRRGRVSSMTIARGECAALLGARGGALRIGAPLIGENKGCDRSTKQELTRALSRRRSFLLGLVRPRAEADPGCGPVPTAATVEFARTLGSRAPRTMLRRFDCPAHEDRRRAVAITTFSAGDHNLPQRILHRRAALRHIKQMRTNVVIAAASVANHADDHLRANRASTSDNTPRLRGNSRREPRASPRCRQLSSARERSSNARRTPMKQADRASTHRCGIRSRARLRSLPISPRIWSESATLRARSTRHGIDAERLPATVITR